MQTELCDVVHIVNQMRPGGIETTVVDLVRHSRHASRIFSLEGTTVELVHQWPALAPLSDRMDCFGRAPRLEPTLVLRIARRLRELKPRTVFLHRINPLLYGGLAARIARVPTIVHVEHDVWQYAQPRRRKLLQWTARCVRPTHFAISDEIAARLGEMLPAARSRVVPGGIDLTRFRKAERGSARAALGISTDVDVIGTVGRLEREKGHSVLIAAMTHLPTSVDLLIVGKGSLQVELAALASELDVADRVHFLGHRDDVDQILPALDLFCLPSHSEGLPRVIMEAQAAGVPIIATDVGSVRQIVDPGTGRLVPSGDPRAFAEAIRASLAQRPESEACRAFAAARFSIDRMVAEYDGMTANREPAEVRPGTRVAS